MKLLSKGRTRLNAPFLFLLFALVVSGLLASPARAQRDAGDIPAVTRAIAIEGVRIVQAPGRVIENGTIVIRDGRIEQVGESVSIPYDAERLSPDSMTVYAAFIDGLSHVGVPQPEQENNLPPVVDRSDPPNDRAGIQPQRDVRSMLSSAEKSISDLRSEGFGAAHVVPIGRMLPGSGAVILLGGGDAQSLVVKGETALFAQFRGASGMYPGTPMAITAKFRQIYKEAHRRRMMEERFNENATGAIRPEFDEVHYAFFPVLEGNKPVIFYTQDALEIRRALRLQSTLGFSMMLAGLNGGYDAVDELSASGNPLFVTLNLPNKPKWMAKLKRDSLDTILASYTTETRTATFRDVEAERRNLEARQLMSRDAYSSVAARLSEQDVQFGFSTLGADASDIRSNIEEIIERGLSEDAALAALTTNAAANLGVSESLGSIDRGKIANLIVADGPLFDSDTHYHYVFVDGQKFAYDKASRASNDSTDTGNDVLSGSWMFTAFTPDGDQSAEASFRKSGDDWSGTMTYEGVGVPMPFTRIKLDGRSLSVTWNDPDNGPMTVTGRISGDEFEGSISMGGEEMFVTGVRDSRPQ